MASRALARSVGLPATVLETVLTERDARKALAASLALLLNARAAEEAQTTARGTAVASEGSLILIAAKNGRFERQSRPQRMFEGVERRRASGTSLEVDRL
jgi:hypothetical protein